MDKLKSWVGHALDLLERSVSPLSVEPNELDWKSGLSTRLLGLIERGLVREVGTSPQDPKRRYFLANRR